MNTAYFGLQMQWTDGDGNPVKPATKAVTIPYTVAVEGEIEVAANTAQGVEVDVPFEGIGTVATGVYVENLTGQELGMAWGGNFMPNIAPGGVLLVAHPKAVAAGQILALRFFLTKAQVGPGLINYIAFGT